MALYIGTNYHPHDWSRERWEKDIQLMKEAGFNTVRLGHLCWDSYEPEDGRYTFEWFDEVMDGFEAAGIKVFLDVSVRPAPVWVHKLCPGCDIYTKSGIRQSALRRYMEDVDDPDYQYYALRFASVLVRHYKRHPALMGFGLCNEQGAGYLSCSEAARNRFINWLKEKYHTIEELNRAWNTQRWSRKLHSFQEVSLPLNEVEKGAPESWLDMRRFFGDGVLNFMIKLKNTIETEAPGIPHSSNHVAEGDPLGFDYLKGCADFVDYPGIGFYPGVNADATDSLLYILSIYQHRLGELGKPMWCLEFQTGNFGSYEGPEGILRMYALLCLAYRAQMILAWTWRSMLGGEEQYFFGLLDHDGTCSRKYREFAQIASDFDKLEKYAFPYLPKIDIAIAYCYENLPVYEYCPDYYKKPYRKQVQEALQVCYERNLDCNFVDLRDFSGDYRILIIPGHAIMTEKMAENVRKFTENGGIVIMTAYSAKVDGTNTVFDKWQPGLLSDIFGIRIAGFGRTSAHIPTTTGDIGKSRIEIKQEKLEVVRNSDSVIAEDLDYYEYIELKGAEIYANYAGRERKEAITVNRYGKGRAYYTSAETNAVLLGWLFDKIAQEENLPEGLKTPMGVVGRQIAENQYLYVNTTSKKKELTVLKGAYGVLTDKAVNGKLVLQPFEGELLVYE